jgi:hypothetical protein
MCSPRAGNNPNILLWGDLRVEIRILFLGIGFIDFGVAQGLLPLNVFQVFLFSIIK